MTHQPVNHRRSKLHPIGWPIALGLLGVVAVVAMVVFWRRNPTPEVTGHDLPLGVEEAVVIRYAGPRLVARPYRQGTSVNVRIADQSESGPVWVYDVRYIVVQPDKWFDLRDYLTTADGSELSDLPSFQVRGLTNLTKDIETRIEEIQEVGVHIWRWYYETLAGLGVFWVLWLCGLIWIGRPKRAPQAAPPPPEPSLAQQIAQYLNLLRRDGLSTADRARLEILLLRHWRERLSLHEHRMAAACRGIGRDARFGPAYTTLEAWLHDPGAEVAPEEILAQCAPEVKA
jgi:hypothetical protein